MSLDLKEQIARIDQQQEETRKFVAEQHKLIAEASKLNVEALKLTAEAAKLRWIVTSLRSWRLPG